MINHKFTVCCDFDGVLHSYTSPWQAADVIPDPPVEGAMEWLSEMQKHFRVVIHTTRGESEAGCYAVADWLSGHGVSVVPSDVTAKKVPALVYVDDRGWRFTGDNFPTVQQVHEARPWNKPAPLLQKG